MSDRIDLSAGGFQKILLNRLATLLLSELVGCNTLPHHWFNPEYAALASV
ncbi:hypothetical protein OAI54_04100 [Pseudomonadales bacterium]|nr:hypothetical protein [Pseudomonadales bacterium]